MDKQQKTLKNQHSDEVSTEDLKNELSKKNQEIAILEKKLAWFEEQFRLSKSKEFEASSEKTPLEQLQIFNEAEVHERENAKEPELEEITIRRRKGKRGLNKPSFQELPVETVEYELEDQECPNCESPLHSMKKEVRRELTVIPPKVKITEHVKHVYACRTCQVKGDEDLSPIHSAKTPNPVLPGSFVSPSLLAFIIDNKYRQSLPLYRQEEAFKNYGIDITRQNMANWVIRGTEDWLRPLVERMHELLLEETYLHADETTLTVLDKQGEDTRKKNYMWVYTSSESARPIMIYDYQPSRSHKHPMNFLKGYQGFLQTDGFSAYKKLPDVTLVGCFAHARRYFVEAIKAAPKDANPAKSLAQEGKKKIDALFSLEKGYKKMGLSPEERQQMRMEEVKPLTDDFHRWLLEAKTKVLPKSALGKAVNYCLKQWNELIAFLLDPQSALSNNHAERAIKNFVIGRKNFLFCKTPKGATASAMAYSVVTTAAANNLVPFQYLSHLFERLPNIDLENRDELDRLLPWSKELPEECYKPSAKNEEPS